MAGHENRGGQSPRRRSVIFKRLGPSVRKRFAWLRWPEGYGVVRRRGVLFLINLQSWPDRTLVIRGVFEAEQLDRMIAAIRQRHCEVFLDIGANVGAYSLIVARETPCPRIIAFEADVRNYDQLRGNAFLNRFSQRIEARRMAVSDHNGTVPFLHGNESMTATSLVIERPESVQVPAVRLDDAVEFMDCSIAIKMDIERHELAALAGMQRTLRYNRCFLQVECAPVNASAFVANISALGYRQIDRIGDDFYFTNF